MAMSSPAISSPAAERCLPDFAGGSLLNLMATLVAGRSGDPGAATPAGGLATERVAARRNIILLLVDGLGDSFLTGRAADSYMASRREMSITSVFPPTTATAITTLLTGQSPAEHGLLGWFTYSPGVDDVIAVLPYERRGSDLSLAEEGLQPEAFFGRRAVFERMACACYTVIPAHLACSPYNESHSTGAAVAPYTTRQELFQTILRLAREPAQKYVYAYWPQLDQLAHDKGIASGAVRRHFTEIDADVATLAAELAGTDTLLIVTGDHGLIDLSPRLHVDTAAHPELLACLSRPLSGESRAAYCHVQPGANETFEAYVASHLASRFELRTREQLLAEGWFGPGPAHPELGQRIGDYVLLARGAASIKDWLPGERHYRHVGAHGGLSRAEMTVPLILIED